MNTGKKKVIHIIDSLRTGGAEILVLNTIKELAEFDHVVIAMNKPEDLRDTLPPEVRYYCLRFNFKWTLISTLIRMRKIVKAENPDIIHAHLYWSIILARLSRTKRAKFIFTLHGMMGLRLFKRKISLYRILEKLTISSSQHLVAVSKTVYDDYVRYIPFKGPSAVIYNYVPGEFFENKKECFEAGEAFRLVTVGTLRAIKNHEVIIRAIGMLGRGYSLDIYGYGDLEEKLKKLTGELNANVIFRGGQKEIYKILPEYDLFVMSSVSEGHSIALLEAMALQLPVILSDIPSFRETTMGKALFYKTDDAAELAERIVTMKNDSALRRQVAESCHAAVLQEATREKYLASIRQLYKTND